MAEGPSRPIDEGYFSDGEEARITVLRKEMALERIELFDLAIRVYERDPTEPLGYVEDELSYNPVPMTLTSAPREHRLWALGKLLKEHGYSDADNERMGP